MSAPIRLSVSGRSADTDAPTVEDLIAQVADCFGILRGVEQALAEDGAIEIDWRVTGATKRSPIALELTPFPRTHGMNVESRAALVKKHAAGGLSVLRTKAERPDYFTDDVLEKAERLFERVTNGLSLTRIEFGDDLPTIEIDPAEARAAASNALSARTPKDKPYQEIGSVEGTLQRVERDGFGRPILFVKLRLNGETVKCVAKGGAQTELEHHEIGEIWKSRRLRVFGVIHYRGPGRIAQVESDSVRFLRPRGELPSASDIRDENFTGGMKSEEYLEKLRSGELS